MFVTFFVTFSIPTLACSDILCHFLPISHRDGGATMGKTEMAAIEKIKALKSDAARLATFHEEFARKYSDRKHYDKQGYGFNQPGERTGGFTANVFFSAYCGTYGSSSVYSEFCVSDKDRVAKAFVAAVNKHQKLLFATMAEDLMAEASKLRADAEKEVAQLQAMLHEIDQPEANAA